MLVYNYNSKVYNWFKMICFLLFYLYRSATRSPLVPARDRRRVRWMAPSWGGKLGADGLVGSLKRYTGEKSNQCDQCEGLEWADKLIVIWSVSRPPADCQMRKRVISWAFRCEPFVALDDEGTGELTFEEDICQNTDWSDFFYKTQSTVMIHSWLKWH